MKKSKVACDLQSCDFCKHCNKEWLPAVETKRQTLFYRRGEVLFNEGEPVNGIYFVNAGAVKVHKKWTDEKELIVRFANKGAIVGHRGLGTELVFPVSGTAVEDSTVCFIPIDFFNASLKVNHDYLYRLMLFFADELKLSEKRMRNMAHMSVKGRLALALVNLQEIFGVNGDGAIHLTITKQDLASYTGATYETVFRVLNEMSDEALISLSGKSITVLDEVKLRAISQPPD
ncbi:MAG TPA: Crp/Fnr family transcriptional regulator [Ferruginibacter sp.]|nr:Crp/Fnr family transcriptional regulator [Ferruginibacter sp.]HMP20144.1 Crp/Fnr family transcriptional regulator [Ferruginibacter sp.]